MINSIFKRFQDWLTPLIFLSSNVVSLTGIVLVTAAAISWVFLLPTLVRSDTQNPYIGIVGFLMLPGVFIFGLVLIPVGIAIRRARMKREGLSETNLPPLTLESVQLRRLLYFVGVTTVANLIIATQWGYSAVNYMESPSFCGRPCHTVMQAEYTAYQGIQHSHIECIKCHAGPGASGFAEAKLAGVVQMWKLMTSTYERPIPTPIHKLHSSDTCQNCHSLEGRGQRGDVLRVITKFGDDEKNAPARTVLLMHVGAIHAAHMGQNVTIRYASDEKRENISWVERSIAGQTTVYTAAGAKPVDSKQGAPGETREMDCLDCHNRPAHPFELPERAVDAAMLGGSISTQLPFARKQAVEILKKTYTNREEAAAQIPTLFAQFYQKTYPDVYAAHKTEVAGAGARLAAIYGRNVFPEMKVTWGTYPNDLGHTDFTGCFRCHDDGHASPSGTKIVQDCTTCHNPIAMDESAPKILGDLGIPESPQ
jgi:hypothetical protein